MKKTEKTRVGGELIEIMPRKVITRGASAADIINQQKLRQYFFQEEWEKLALRRSLPQFPEKRSIKVLYPGCGADLFTPLLYLEQLFPQLEKAELLLADLRPVQEVMKTLLDEVGIGFSEEEDVISFYWKGRLSQLTIMEGNIFELLPALPAFDVYFERAFRLIKDQHQGYEERILEKLPSGGLIVSDSGFEKAKLRRFSVPAELSAYGEMVVGIKEK